MPDSFFHNPWPSFQPIACKYTSAGMPKEEKKAQQLHEAINTFSILLPLLLLAIGTLTLFLDSSTTRSSSRLAASSTICSNLFSRLLRRHKNNNYKKIHEAL